jgi:hypothetical protein
MILALTDLLLYVSGRWSEKNPIALFLPLVPEPVICGTNGKNSEMGFFSDHKSSPTRGWAFVPTGLYFYSRSCASICKFWPARSLSGMIFALVDPVSIWRHGNWTRGVRFMLDLWSEKNPIALFLPFVPETRWLVSGTNSKYSAMGFISDQ